MKKNVARHVLMVVCMLCFLTGCGRQIEVSTNGGDFAPHNDCDEEPEIIYIFAEIVGAVNSPGVYRLESGARVFQLVELAGGLTEDAALLSINQAEKLVDGQMVIVSSKEEFSNNPANATNANDGKININLADKTALMTLRGIGEAKAESIISYRAEHGAFVEIEELLNVDGIKEGVFKNIKDDITV